MQMQAVTDGLRFPEGPVAMADGSVLLVEMRRGTLTRVTPDGRRETIAHLGGGPNGAAIGPDGACYVCNNGDAWAWQEGETHSARRSARESLQDRLHPTGGPAHREFHDPL